MKSPLTFEKAFNELARIIEEIDSGKVKIDTLSEKINKARELIKFCQDSLRSTEEEFQNAMKEIKKE